MATESEQKVILVVDDVPTNIAAIAGVLRAHYRVRVASNGERALAIAGAPDRPDLILLDITMPEMDGYEVCRRLKADAATREIPVIFLTAMTTTEDEQKGFETGAVDYIHKPFSAPIVLARVHTHLALRSALNDARTERATLASVMDSMTDGLIAAGDDGVLRFCNQRASELLRFDLGRFIGRRMMEAVDETTSEYADPGTARQAWSKILSGGRERQTVELTLAGPPRLDLQVQSFPLVGSAGGTFGLIIHDITGEREATRAKDEMMRLVSHELKAPLTNLLGFTELLITRKLTDEQISKFLTTMLSEEERLSTLINDFLDIERMAIAGHELVLVPTDLAELIRKAVDASGPDQAHPFSLTLPPNLPSVRADPNRIIQVLMNLFSNARKYSPEGGQIRVAAVARDGYVAVMVSDDGLGIPAESQSRLFEKFYRVHNREHSEIRGTGLGLAICRQIVEAHRGRIWALSGGTGKGSTFGFSIPVDHEGASAEE